MPSTEARLQAKALTALIDEADEYLRVNGTVSRGELARELEVLDVEWQADDRRIARRTSGR